MASKTKEVGVRLSVKDADIAKRALTAFGAEGAGALKRIEGSARPAAVSIHALNAAVGAGRNALSGFVLGSLGAVTSALSLSAAIHQTRAALEMFGDIADKSKTAGVDAEFFQGLAFQAKLAGGSLEDTAAALETFARATGLAAEGKGKLYSTLQALNPELMRNIQLATTQEQRVRLAADALANAASASERAALAGALFGSQGDVMARAFEKGAASIDETIAKARQLGIIVDRETIARADELGDKLDTVSTIVDIKLKKAFVDAAPALVWLVEQAGNLASAFNIVLDQFREVEERTQLFPLQNQLADLHNRRFALGDAIQAKEAEGVGLFETMRQGDLSRMRAEYDAMIDEALRLQDRIAELLGRGRTPPPLSAPKTPPNTPSDLPLTAEAKAAIKDAEALMERLRDSTEAYDASLSDLAMKLGAGLISVETFNRGQGEAAIKFAQAADSSAEYAAALETLNLARDNGVLSEQRYSDAVEKLSEKRLIAQNSWLAGLELGLDKISQGADEVTTDVARAVMGWADSLGDQIGNVFRTGKFEWKDLVTTMLADIAKLATQQMITRPLAGFLSGLVGGLFGGGLGTIGVGGVGVPSGGFVPGVTGPRLFEAGGYTGDMARSTAAGIVHGQEYVMNAETTRRIGRANLDAMSAGRMPSAGGAMTIHLEPHYNIEGSGLSDERLLAVMEQHDRVLLDNVSNRVKRDIAMGGWD